MEINLRLEKYSKFEEDLPERQSQLAKQLKTKKRLKLEVKWKRRELKRRNKFSKKYTKLVEKRAVMHNRFLESIKTEKILY